MKEEILKNRPEIMDFLNSNAVRDLKNDPKDTPEEGLRRPVECIKRIYK